MTTDQLKQKLWQKTNSSSEMEASYWKNISFAMEAIENSCNGFLNNNNPAIAASYGKLLIMELWSLRELLICLNKRTTELDNLIPNLKEFRDAYAHLKERVEGFERPFGRPRTNLNLAHKSVANGVLTNSDGNNWRINNSFSRLFNFNLDGTKGVTAIFGIINNFLICNSSTDLLELEITEEFNRNVIDIINDASA